LDLFFTNNPTLIQQTKVIPGISDHEMVIIDSLIKTLQTKAKPKTVFQYHKGNFIELCKELEEYKNGFISKCDSMSTEEMCSDYVKKLLELQNKFIPQKTVETKHNLPQ